MDTWHRIKLKIARAGASLRISRIVAGWNRRPRWTFSECFWWLVPSFREFRDAHRAWVRTVFGVEERKYVRYYFVHHPRAIVEVSVRIIVYTREE
ncbi:hypothetical protein [Noviherbaspirillum sp.]|uniref:hypothetical protein n=1 Tax=Noviherbaspirillum sp. TaxID=1926288 RepID=UPI002D6A8593|nr:hypothetical protein [Noviherbaspirillum sp.]HZW21870.1 hypothetical protein [Noviherbaspirillum sp.]